MTTMTLGGKTYLVQDDGSLAPAPQGDGSTVQAYEPGVMDRARAWAQDKLTGVGGMDNYEARGLSERLLGRPFARPQSDGLSSMADATGLLGVFGATAPLTLKQSEEDYEAGRYGSSALNAAFGMAEAVPFAGMASRGIQRALPQVGRTAASMAEIGDLARSGSYAVGQPLRVADGSYAAGNGRPSAVSIPDVGRFDARPVGPIEEAAREYMQRRGVPDFGPLRQYPDFDEDRAGAIGAAYDAMKHDPNDPLVRRAYDAMISETMDQYEALKGTGIDFRFLQEGMSDPYSRSPSLGYQDMVENGRLWVFPTDFGFGSSTAFDPTTNPLLKGVGKVGDKSNAVANDAFRVVHDAFGHFGPGNPFFRHKGEERAWVEHSRMYSPEARGAMTSETRGQNSWLNFGPHGAANRTALGDATTFADQKTGLLPEWMWYEGGR